MAEGHCGRAFNILPPCMAATYAWANACELETGHFWKRNTLKMMEVTT